jgi:hypothetical protein
MHAPVMMTGTGSHCCRYSKYAQLATVRLDGRPANRTVVFRSVLVLFAGSRTGKLESASNNMRTSGEATQMPSYIS